MASPSSISSASPNSPIGSPTSSSRQAASNGFKFVVGGALLLMTGASIYVAVTSNFSSVPDILNTPFADIPKALVTKERKLVEESLPWKIREPRPWRISLKETSHRKDSDETKPAEAKEIEGKEEAKKPEVNVEIKKEIVKESPKEREVKKNNTIRVPAKKTDEPAKKALEASKQSEKKAEENAEAKQDKKETPKQQSEEQKAAETPKQEAKQTAKNLQVKKDSSNKKKPLNILLLYGDDWRHDSIGSASNGLVKTPFFDDLATQGVRFTHNCVTTSVCWVSRATLYTGQYVSRHKSTEPTKPEFYEGWNKTFPYLLREAGYYFGHVGKWHFKDYEVVKPTFHFERFYYGRHWFHERQGPVHATKKNERDALDFLRERPKDQPFCLTVCFFTPHAQDGEPEQFLPQNESLALYVNDTIPLAPSATEEAWKKMPKFFGERNEGRNRFFWRFDTPEKYQKMMKNYYRLISEIDQTSGELVLDTSVVVVVLFSLKYQGAHQHCCLDSS